MLLIPKIPHGFWGPRLPFRDVRTIIMVTPLSAGMAEIIPIQINEGQLYIEVHVIDSRGHS